MPNSVAVSSGGLIAKNRQNLNGVVNYLDFKPSFVNEGDYSGQDFIGMPLIITDAGKTQCCQLPRVIVVNFRNAHIESVLYPGSDGLDDLPLALQ